MSRRGTGRGPCQYTNIPELGVRRGRSVFTAARHTIFGAGALLPAPYSGPSNPLRLAAGPRPTSTSFARDDEATGAAPTALCLYTRFDGLALARVLGDARRGRVGATRAASAGTRDLGGSSSWLCFCCRVWLRGARAGGEGRY